MMEASSQTQRRSAGFSVLAHPKRALKAVATNQIARFAPGLYVRLTGQTGRGAAAEEGASDIAQYFSECVEAYLSRLGVQPSDAKSFLDGKTLLEYGPGDLPGVAALMVARGAGKVYCVDRFPLVQLSDKNAQVMRDLMQRCSASERARLASCLRQPSNPASGFAPERIEYLVRPSGLSGMREQVDMVFSRAVLEHVDDLHATFHDMVAALKPGGLAIHQIDLRSHGLHKHNPLDFLAWSPAAWRWMYSAKGVPNRWRVDTYRRIVGALDVEVQQLEPTALAPAEQIRSVRPLLAAPFQGISDEDLACLGFWLVFRKPLGVRA